MDSTKPQSANDDKQKILELCTKMHTAGECRNVLSAPSVEAESYYDDRSELRFFDSELYEYDYSNPAELRTMLQKMWEYQQCGFMQEFAVPATVAAFHQKKDEPEKSTGGEIPSFIYNF